MRERRTQESVTISEIDRRRTPDRRGLGERRHPFEQVQDADAMAAQIWTRLVGDLGPDRAQQVVALLAARALARRVAP